MIYAEEVGHYWKTSQSSPDRWIERARKQIEKLEGTIHAEGFGAGESGEAAYMLAFSIGEDRFKLVWPVLPSKTGNKAAARRQAATMLFHDVKAKSVSAAVLGARAAFFSYLMLPDGRAAAEVTVPELASVFPNLLVSGSE